MLSSVYIHLGIYGRIIRASFTTSKNSFFLAKIVSESSGSYKYISPLQYSDLIFNRIHYAEGY